MSKLYITFKTPDVLDNVIGELTDQDIKILCPSNFSEEELSLEVAKKSLLKRLSKWISNDEYLTVIYDVETDELKIGA